MSRIFLGRSPRSARRSKGKIIWPTPEMKGLVFGSMPIAVLVPAVRKEIKRGRCSWIFDPQRGVAYTLGIRPIFDQFEIILRCRSYPKSQIILQAWVNDVAEGLLLGHGSIGEFGYSLREPDEELVDCALALKILYGEQAGPIELFWSDSGFWKGKEGKRRSEREIRQRMRERQVQLLEKD